MAMSPVPWHSVEAGTGFQAAWTPPKQHDARAPHRRVVIAHPERGRSGVGEGRAGAGSQVSASASAASQGLAATGQSPGRHRREAGGWFGSDIRRHPEACPGRSDRPNSRWDPDACHRGEATSGWMVGPVARLRAFPWQADHDPVPTGGRALPGQPRLYLNREDFEAETDKAFMMTKQEGAMVREGRWEGKTHRIELNGDLRYTSSAVDARINPADSLSSKPPPARAHRRATTFRWSRRPACM